jgi:mono/diheme cytochrome c family protein
VVAAGTTGQVISVEAAGEALGPHALQSAEHALRPAKQSPVRLIPSHTQDAAPSSLSGEHAAVIKRYCVTCHNSRLKTAGLMLDSLDIANVGPAAETWEKVLRKLRATAMPPVGSPRPDRATYASLSSFLESELDRAASTHPNAGRTAVYHRLNRTEYQNAVRDILGLDIDVAGLLPGDDAAFGFDNIGEMLTVSPDLLDGHLSAANKISRLAIGDAALALGSATYPVSKYLLQSDRMSEQLPFGSRGGIAVRHYFPSDGDYVIKVRFQGVSRPPQPVEIRVDGTRVASLVTAGRDLEDTTDKGAVETRVSVKAGPRVVGVSFLKPILPGETRYPLFYPWGNSATFGTNVGSIRYLSVETVDVAGPFAAQGRGDTPSRRQIFECLPAKTRDEEPCARRILDALARRAFRRTVTNADVQPLLEFYRTARKERDFEGSIQMAIERLLVDPDFLFRIERDPAGSRPLTPYRISAVELASRLSFFLWSSVPDNELLQLAERGKLFEPVVLEQQVRRMLADPRSTMVVDNFAAQWLFLRNLRAARPDSFQFPDWDENLRFALSQETEMFLESQLREDRSVAELLNANYTFLNERLARHYGISGVYGNHFRRVTLPDDKRGGLLGHGSILLVTSFANRTSPVVRGKWLLENFLNYQPPPPPPNVPDLAENDKGQPARSIRERMEQHRKNPVCAGCHAVMDPLGFSLEHYDAIGAWRAKADGLPIETAGVMPDGTKFEGLTGLRSVLQSRRDDFVTTVTEKLLTYAIGRGVEYYDQPAIRKIVRDAAASDYKWSSIVLGITNSLPFQMRMPKVEP